MVALEWGVLFLSRFSPQVLGMRREKCTGCGVCGEMVLPGGVSGRADVACEVAPFWGTRNPNPVPLHSVSMGLLIL